MSANFTYFNISLRIQLIKMHSISHPPTSSNYKSKRMHTCKEQQKEQQTEQQIEQHKEQHKEQHSHSLHLRSSDICISPLIKATTQYINPLEIRAKQMLMQEDDLQSNSETPSQKCTKLTPFHSKPLKEANRPSKPQIKISYPSTLIINICEENNFPNSHSCVLKRAVRGKCGTCKILNLVNTEVLKKKEPVMKIDKINISRRIIKFRSNSVATGNYQSSIMTVKRLLRSETGSRNGDHLFRNNIGKYQVSKNQGQQQPNIKKMNTVSTVKTDQHKMDPSKMDLPKAEYCRDNSVLARRIKTEFSRKGKTNAAQVIRQRIHTLMETIRPVQRIPQGFYSVKSYFAAHLPKQIQPNFIN